MSALARFFHSRGFAVSGYDKTPTALTDELIAEGIAVHFEDDPERIPKDAGIVVYTPAIPPGHRELNYYREQGYPVVKRSDVLQEITKSSFNICMAGTHGKTTITTMVAHLLRDSGFGCNAFLGGISGNYGTNYWGSDRNVCVVEADEYDRSFLKLEPDIALITAMDADHLDIYGTPATMEEAFIAFAEKIRSGGMLLSRYGLKREKELQETVRTGQARALTYHLENNQADVYAEQLRITEGTYLFDVRMPGTVLENVRLNMGGLHNVENALAAIAVAVSLGIGPDKIRKAVDSFRGVKRRFEYILKNDRFVLIDDYAHHPEELKALVRGAKSLFGSRKCTVIFQPHLYTRTRDLAAGFAEALDGADEVILLPIYPARELPVAGVSSEMILEKMKQLRKSVKSKEELLQWIEETYLPQANRENGELLVMAGAGDIDLLVEPVKERLEK